MIFGQSGQKKIFYKEILEESFSLPNRRKKMISRLIEWPYCYVPFPMQILVHISALVSGCRFLGITSLFMIFNFSNCCSEILISCAPLFGLFFGLFLFIVKLYKTRLKWVLNISYLDFDQSVAKLLTMRIKV